MKMHRVVASVLCMALLLTLCLSVACSEGIMPFAETGNLVWVGLSFSNGKVIGDGKVTKLEAGCTASTTVYVQAKSGSRWTTKASGSGGREASASCTAQKGTEYRAYAVATIYDSEGNKGRYGQELQQLQRVLMNLPAE